MIVRDSAAVAVDLHPLPDAALDSPRDDVAVAWATLAIIGVGIVVRITHYLLRLPIWNDEAMLATNFLHRGFGGLVRPLDNCQVAPLLFLWIESAVVQTLGFTEYTLRFAPLLASIGALILFDQLARRVLDLRARLIAVGMLAVAHYPIRYSAEVKPYAWDFLASVATLSLALAWLRSRDQNRWLWLLALWAPAAVILSVPAPFALGGVILGLAPAAYRTGSRRTWTAFSIFIVSLLTSFGLYLRFFLEPHSRAQELGMSQHWAEAFMPLKFSWELPRFLIESATGVAFSYPIGGENFGSSFTSVLFCVGAWTMLRQGRGAMLGVLLGPFAVGLAASALHKYPFGGHARVMQYLGPSVCLLAGLGAAELIARLATLKQRERTLAVVASLFIALGVGCMFKLMVRPYYELACRQRRDFAEWFWEEQATKGPLVCINDSLQRRFPQGGVYPPTCEYQCNRAIYEKAPVDAPTGYLLQWVTPTPTNFQAVDKWLAEMTASRDLISRERYRIGDRELFEVFRFADRRSR